jgi:hypothetical protein
VVLEALPVAAGLDLQRQACPLYQRLGSVPKAIRGPVMTDQPVPGARRGSPVGAATDG